MDYPRAFIFVDKGTPLPTLDTLQKWFQVQRADNLYVQGISPSDDDVDFDIKIMTRLQQYAMESELLLRCVVVSTTEIALFARTSLDQNWQGIAWIDSEEEAEMLHELPSLISSSEDFAVSLWEPAELHGRCVGELEDIEEQAGLTGLEDLNAFSKHMVNAKIELRNRINRLINQLTHPGARSRPELSNRLPNQAAA